MCRTIKVYRAALTVVNSDYVGWFIAEVSYMCIDDVGSRGEAP
jgi:hypothetical protein